MAKANHITGIDCDGPASAAIRLVLIARFEEMCGLRDQALDWNDPEGVHDMRVSSRRLRGALGDFMPYLHKRKLADVLEELRNVGAALGSVRDQDVAIIGLQKQAAGAPPEATAMVEQLVQARDKIRKQARNKLTRVLQKGRLKQLQNDFMTAMDSATANAKPAKRRPRNAATKAEAVYRDVARQVVTERLKEVEKLSGGLYRPLKMKPLHRMRIAAKRFRYALELFQPCWGPDIAEFAKKIAALQSSLGELHDSDIWIETFGKELHDVAGESQERRNAALWLLSHFVRLHSKHLRDTLAKWSEWEGKEYGSRLRASLLQDSVKTAQLVAPFIPPASLPPAPTPPPGIL